MNESDISKLVKELREQLELTQEQFAQKVGTTYSTVNHWENGKRMPQPFFIRCLLELKEELDKRGQQGTEGQKPSAREDE